MVSSSDLMSSKEAESKSWHASIYLFSVFLSSESSYENFLVAGSCENTHLVSAFG